MRALVAGCAGFIGSHFSRRLLREGWEVVGVDNLCTGSRRNVDELTRERAFRFIAHDICEPLPAAVQSAGRPDWVCNLACPASPVDFGPKRLEIMAVCSRGVRNLAELAVACGARLLHTSTSEVYGDPREHPQRETYWGNVNPIGPRSCYDEGKRFAEALLTAYEAQRGLELRLVRIFNTYGPNMRPDDGRALPNFISQALANQPITVHGDGRQTRSFCYIDDQVEGLWRLARSDARGPVNIGNPNEVTLIHAAREVVRLCNSRSEIVHVERPLNDPSRRCPDISRARKELGWAPLVEIADGFARTIEWFRSMLHR